MATSLPCPHRPDDATKKVDVVFVCNTTRAIFSLEVGRFFRFKRKKSHPLKYLIEQSLIDIYLIEQSLIDINLELRCYTL